MNPATIAIAVEARIKVDTTLWVSADSTWTAAVAGGVWCTNATPATVTYPYIVFEVDIPNAEHAFSGVGAAFTITFTIVDGRQNSTNSPGLSRISTLIDRLFGDSMLVTGDRVGPSYGFHNYNLVLAANPQTLVCSATSSVSASIRPGQDEHTTEAVVTYAGFVSATCANAG